MPGNGLNLKHSIPLSAALGRGIDQDSTLDYHPTMNYPNPQISHTPNTSRYNPRAGPSRRPATISELAERASIPWDESKGFKHHLKLAEKHRRDGKEYARSGDVENAFVELAKAATLVLERLPEHPEYNTKLNSAQRQNLGLNGQEILDNLADLKPGIVDRYEKWRQAHPNGVDEDTTPNGRTQQLANDNAARARSQRELQIQDEEAARGILQLKEQERIAEEANRWVRQRQQLEEEARRQEMTSSAAHKSSNSSNVLPRPPNLFPRSNMQMPAPGHGSQNTVVLMDGQDRSHSNQQEQMRQREQEITRRQEQKRREEEGIKRRQYESEEAARAARQNLARSDIPYPRNNTAPESAPPTLSFFPTHLGASSSTVAKPMFYPTAVQYPTLGPTAMPLESPHYEGDSTDSESLHHDFRRLGMDSNNHRSPLKPVRSSSYPPPVTTTSPIPGSGPIRYPSLMTQHQKTQGYYPSLGSMFADPANRQHGSSLLLASNSTDARVADSTSPWAPHPPNQQPPGEAPPPYPHQHQHPQQNQHAHQQRHPLPNPATYMRPPPPPATSISETSAQSQLKTESNRIMQASDANFDPRKPLKGVSLPRECLPRFLAIAKVNTEMNKETCGLLLGKDKGHKYSVTTLLIPKQTSTSDTCTMLEEELVLQFTEERSLITLGWIHTHPSQSCFMSSVDLHTHSGFQRMLPESFAIVCAPKFSPNFGIFRITDPPGLDVILSCQAKEAFHPHPDLAIYTDADKGHVQMKDIALEIVDLR